jgi:hypothetical protein
LKAAALVFTNCNVTKGNPTCELEKANETITTVPVTATVKTGTGTAVSGVIKPQTGKEFTAIKFKGASCSLKGEQAVKTKTGATISGPEGQTELEEQPIVANTGSGELEVGSSAATLKGKAKLKLTTAEKWSFQK